MLRDRFHEVLERRQRQPGLGFVPVAAEGARDFPAVDRVLGWLGTAAKKDEDFVLVLSRILCFFMFF